MRHEGLCLKRKQIGGEKQKRKFKGRKKKKKNDKRKKSKIIKKFKLLKSHPLPIIFTEIGRKKILSLKNG